MNKRIITLALAAVMSVTLIAPATERVSAQPVAPVTVSTDANVKYTPYAAQAKKLEDAQKELRFNTETIYDLDSIPARAELLLSVGKAITKATTDLSKKVQKAHTEIGFEIARSIFKALNPFEGVEGIKQQEMALEALLEKVETYPELTPTDVATIYYKGKLDRAIWNTRFSRDREILGKKSFATYAELNKAITKAVGVWFRGSSTCIDVDNAVADLEAAYQKALNGK